jgi:hypothetical protein
MFVVTYSTILTIKLLFSKNVKITLLRKMYFVFAFVFQEKSFCFKMLKINTSSITNVL